MARCRHATPMEISRGALAIIAAISLAALFYQLVTPRDRISEEPMSALVGARRFPIEDVPDDAFDRSLSNERPPAPGQLQLVTGLVQLYAPGALPPRFKRLRPRGYDTGVFGGRFLESSRGIVVYEHANTPIERGVTVHETCHYIRLIHGCDRDGEHDVSFLSLVEDAYRVVRVPCEIAKLIEGQYPRSWQW